MQIRKIVTNFVLVIIYSCSAQLCLGQSDSTDYYKAFLKLPSFSINKIPDSTAYTQLNITKQKPLVIIFFSPDCEHCQKEATELVAGKDSLKNIPILMLSIYSMKEINAFYEKYGFASMNNVTMGQDLNFRLGSIYRMKTFPAIYIYDKHQNLQKALVGHASVARIVEIIEQAD